MSRPWPYHYSPQDVLAALGRHVTVTLKSSETFKGNLYSIDPLSFAVLLLKDSNPATMTVIMEHAILALHIHDDIEPMPRDVLDRSITVDPADFTFDSAATQARKQALIELFTAQRLPIEHSPNDASLRILNCARIEPPYISTSVVCDNEVVLRRVREIVMRV
ncbi:hypothetical protein BC937DRAFT_86984 [Endogone sp. FLAS-F59071]|nr:hypothetical protein BC937DRAFT_86984 [Endogone sp. FLAS-F59071]|eukprot:RUS22777.1 hypothetical protein BC937DRAFT_86984 [Endogone sp. FLAS-F59071]